DYWARHRPPRSPISCAQRETSAKSRPKFRNRFTLGDAGRVASVTVYALNLCDIADRAEYLAYSRRSPQEVAKHGGRVVALGQFRESITGDIAPRTVLILVEWDSREAFQSYCDDPELADLHPHRENGASSYIWHL